MRLKTEDMGDSYLQSSLKESNEWSILFRSGALSGFCFLSSRELCLVDLRKRKERSLQQLKQIQY